MAKNEETVSFQYDNFSLWDSKAEQEVFQYLQGMVNTEHFQIFPHMPISEVFKKFRKYEVFKETYIERHFELSHFDFTIYNQSSYLPVLIIEADGARHKTNPWVIFKGQAKRDAVGQPLT